MKRFLLTLLLLSSSQLYCSKPLCKKNSVTYKAPHTTVTLTQKTEHVVLEELLNDPALAKELFSLSNTFIKQSCPKTGTTTRKKVESPLCHHLKKQLIKKYRVTFLRIFSEALSFLSLPATKAIAGGFCEDPNYFVLLSYDPEQAPVLSLWSVTDLEEKSSGHKPLYSTTIILPQMPNTVAPYLLKTAQKSNRFIICDYRRQKIQIWHIVPDKSPPLQQGTSLPLRSNDPVTLNPDGTLLTTNTEEPELTSIKHCLPRKNSVEELDELSPRSYIEGMKSPACFSGNGAYFTSQSADTLQFWQVTESTKDTPAVSLHKQLILQLDRGIAEALDPTGRYLITSKKQSLSYYLWDCKEEVADELFQRKEPANPISRTPHEPVSFSADGTLLTISCANQAPILYDLINKDTAPISLGKSILRDNEVVAIFLNSSNNHVLYLQNGNAFLIPLWYPMEELNLEQLYVLLKVEQEGASFIEDDYFAAIYESLPKQYNLCTNTQQGS